MEAIIIIQHIQNSITITDDNEWINPDSNRLDITSAQGCFILPFFPDDFFFVNDFFEVSDF
jgi:hypothetical protein